MKKTISMILLLCMVLALAACGGSSAPAATEAPAEAPAATEAPAAEEAPAEAPAAGGEFKLGMGIVTSFDSCDTNKAQLDSTAATVVLDAEGKIVLCRIDCAQNAMDVTDGFLTLGGDYRTKMEKGADYGMAGVSPIGAEWDAQAKAFEEYVVGLTGEEVANMETQLVNDHNISTDEALLAGCTMDITDMKEAVAKACADEWAVAFSAESADFTLGLACITDDSGSTEATEDEPAVVKMHTEFGAAVVSAEGKILAALNDAIQPNIEVAEDGTVTPAEYNGSKRELGDDYGMVAFGAAIAEWDAQSDAFSKAVVGMTADEVAGMETKEHNGHQVTVDETLFASCTMDITGMRAVIAQAASTAR